jgi:hypothetical protein
MPARLIAHVRGNLVGCVALFVALGGTAYAAGTFDGGQLKDRSVGARKVMKGTLTGVEINESKLGAVPSAKLGGLLWARVDSTVSHPNPHVIGGRGLSVTASSDGGGSGGGTYDYTMRATHDVRACAANVTVQVPPGYSHTPARISTRTASGNKLLVRVETTPINAGFWPGLSVIVVC